MDKNSKLVNCVQTFLIFLIGCVGCADGVSVSDVVQASGDDPCISDPVLPGRDPEPDGLCHQPGTTRQQSTLDAADNAQRHAGYNLGSPPAVTAVACDQVSCELVWDFPDGSGFWLETRCLMHGACTSNVCWFIIGDGSPHCLTIEP